MSNVYSTFTTIVIVVIFIGLYCYLDYRLGRNKHIASLKTKSLPLRTGQVEIITNGTKLFDRFFQDLRQARKNIHIISYICKSDRISQDFCKILMEKAGEGLEVRLLIDWAGGFRMRRKQIKELKKAGVRFAFARKPKLPYLFYSVQVRNHRKISVIDGQTAYLGGYNIGDEYIGLHKKLSPWRDYHMRITGEGVRDLQEQFLLDWEEAAKVKIRAAEHPGYFPVLQKGTVRHRFFPSEGSLLEQCFIRLFKNAQSSVFIGSPYFIPSRAVFRELLLAIDRGVACTVLVPQKADHPLVKEASFSFLRKLLKRGAKVYQYTDGFYHAKVLLIDDKICDLGTANFDKRSIFWNMEINCFIYEKSVIEEVKEIFGEDISHSRELRLEDLQGFHPFRTAKELAARALSFFL